MPCPAQPVPERAGGSRGAPGAAAAHRAGPDRGGGRGRAGRGAERLRSAGTGGVSEAAARGGGSRISETAAAPAPAPGTVRRAQVRAALPTRRSHRRDLGSRRAPAARRRLQSPGAGGGAARTPAIPRSRRGRATAGLGDRCAVPELPELRDESRARARAAAQEGPGCGRSGWHRGCSRRSLPGSRRGALGERLGAFSAPGDPAAPSPAVALGGAAAAAPGRGCRQRRAGTRGHCPARRGQTRASAVPPALPSGCPGRGEPGL